jgi:hypothetical protein
MTRRAATSLAMHLATRTISRRFGDAAATLLVRVPGTGGASVRPVRFASSASFG